ncbi:uncharacterized protein METZ01_LOCUS260725, partial [marine metagenome]
MIFRLVFGFILLFSSCKEPPELLSIEETSIILDTDSPIIKWISPSFDAVVNEVVTVSCQVTDTSGIASVELWVDSMQTNLLSMSVSDSTYALNWSTSNYNEGDKPLLSIYAVDNAG